MILSLYSEMKISNIVVRLGDIWIDDACPLWTEWGNCSQSCWGMKTRIDRCNYRTVHNITEQMKSCNQFSSCPRSG